MAVAVADGNEPGLTLAAWRARGLHRFDPVRFRVIEALARRAADQPAGPTVGVLLAQQVLQGRLATLMAAYGQRHAQAQVDAHERVEQAVDRFPVAADALRRCLAGGDFKALQRLIAALEHPAPASPLAELVRHVDRQTSPPASGHQADPARAAAGEAGGLGGLSGQRGALAELKAVRVFRSTWARLSVDQQLTRSLARIPEQAGPLNSQLLVLRALTLMRDVSPAYLGRFMAYVDALTWLDEAAAAGPTVAVGAGRNEADKKRKPGRSKTS